MKGHVLYFCLYQDCMVPQDAEHSENPQKDFLHSGCDITSVN